MPAGKSETTLGLGRQPLWTCNHFATDSTNIHHACGDSAGESISPSFLPKVSMDYRLGIKDTWGPFPGAEIEWHLEAPTNPATMEFSLNLAMPNLGSKNFRHKLGAGWGVGAWADNSFFLEYAASMPLNKFGKPLIFGNLRATYLATQINEVLSENFSQALPSNQVLVMQAGLGTVFNLPKIILLPDYIIPAVNLTLPQIPSGERLFHRQNIPYVQWDFQLGFGWGI